MIHYVYCTHDDISGRFYIGKHSAESKDDGYLGSGVWVRNCRKGGLRLRRHVIGVCDTEASAYKLEAALVSAARKDHPAHCMNFIAGGRGAYIGQIGPNRGRNWSPETRHKMRLAKLGKKLTERHKESLRLARPAILSERTRFLIGTGMRGKKRTAEWVASMTGGNNVSAKAVVCVETGIVYGSQAEAARAIGCSKAQMCNVCKPTHRAKSAKGLTFKYHDPKVIK